MPINELGNTNRDLFWFASYIPEKTRDTIQRHTIASDPAVKRNIDQIWACLKDICHFPHVLLILLNNLRADRITKKGGLLNSNSWIKIIKYSAQFFVLSYCE
jgi:hypothetical protein